MFDVCDFLRHVRAMVVSLGNVVLLVEMQDSANECGGLVKGLD